MKRLLLLALTALVWAMPLAQADMPSEEQWTRNMDQWQARMKTMHEQMAKLAGAQDPEERQKLLAEHWRLMNEQMDAVNMMGGRMMGPGMMGPGMMGHGMMDSGTMGPGMMGPGMMGHHCMMSGLCGCPMYGMMMMQQMMQQHMMMMHGGTPDGMHKGMRENMHENMHPEQ